MMFYAFNRVFARPLQGNLREFFLIVVLGAVAMVLPDLTKPLLYGNEPESNAGTFPPPIDDEPLAPAEFDSDSLHKGSGPSRPTPSAAADAIFFDNSRGQRDDFTVTAFAAEPDVQNPIGMAWDHLGRLWVAENYTYGKQGEALRTDMADRVVVFQDEDGDGVHDQRTVFFDKLSQLTSVEVGRGGVWLMTPPRLLFIPDSDHDLVPDGPAQTILDGFTVADANYHNFANGLRFGPDRWLYGRCGGSCPGRVGAPGTASEHRTALEGGIWRFNVDTKHFEVICHGTTNPWGHDWNADDELFFINTVNGHLWHAIEGAHFKRPFTLDPNPNVYELIDQHADHYHFDTKGAWTDSRDGAANDFGGGHAHCGMMIYQGATWPKSFDGDLFTLNFHGRRANREVLRSHRSGYIATHTNDFFVSKDSWFRGMEISTGPDGNVYVLDWSDLGECHEHTGVHRTSGRIFKISYQPSSEIGANKPAEHSIVAGLARMSGNVAPQSLLAALRHPNRWFSSQAQKLLSDSVIGKSVPLRDFQWVKQTLESVPCDASVSQRQLIELRALQSLGLIDREEIIDRLDVASIDELTDDAPEVQVKLLSLLTDDWPIDDCYGPNHASRIAWPRIADDVAKLMPVMLGLAKLSPHAPVRRKLASILQRLPLSHRGDLAYELIDRGEDEGDHNIEKLVWYGLMSLPNEQTNELALIASAGHLPTTTTLIARSIGERAQQHPEALDQLFVAWLDHRTTDKCTEPILIGLEQGLVGVAKLDPPPTWDRFLTSVDGVASTSKTSRKCLDRLRQIFSEGQTPDELLSVVEDESIDLKQRVAALAGLMDQETLSDAQDQQMVQWIKKFLGDARINAEVASIAVRREDSGIAKMILANYGRFRAPRRPSIVALICTRTVFANELLGLIESKKLPSSVLTASHVRTLLSLGDESVAQRVETVWGKLRESPSERVAEMERLKVMLTGNKLAAANLSNGRNLFEKNCANCHKMYGQGAAVGPELTGAQRDNLDYWLQNIVDPDAVVSADYRATQVLTEDGRLLVGLVTQRTRRTITLVSADQTWTLTDDEIAESKMIDQSPMPSGLLQPLSDDQIADLIAYLQHPTQVAK